MEQPTTFIADPGNADQVRAWDGEEGAYWARHADDFDAAVAAYHRPLLDAADLTTTSRVLDIGCGAGQTTLDAARHAVHGSALGVDLSGPLLEVARSRAAASGLGNARFEHADAQVHRFDEGRFDRAISRSGAMFFADPVAGFANIARALVPGGRVTLAVWKPIEDNEWFRGIATAMAAGRDLPVPPPDVPGPFAFGDPERTTEVLTAAGFAEPGFEPLHEPMWFGATAEAAFDFISGLVAWMLDGLDESGRRRALDDLLATMRAHEGPDGVSFGSAMWLVTATRR